MDIMKYRKMAGEDVSVLGFGCMRLPLTSKSAKDINEEEAVKLIHTSIENGVNYFDTAYVYHDNESEKFLGRALSGGLRKKVKIATKSPTWEIQKEEDFDIFLNEQLERLQTDYIDFYLMHALDRERFNNIVLKFNLIDKLNKAKEAGKIKHIGFSFHDDLDTFKMIVDTNPAWEFCQIQLNYVNTNYQAGLEGLEYANKKGLGVVIMEPLLGGKLAAPAPQVTEVLDSSKTPVEWAMDFLWNREEVCLLLSGMGAMEQVTSNISYANAAQSGMLSEENLSMLKKAKETYEKMSLVPCTRCGYCMPCPFGLDIPKIYDIYNLTAAEREAPREMYKNLQKKADACKKCKACEKVCPQSIKTSSLMPVIDKFFNS